MIHRARHSAFTLLEMMTVITIIVVVLALGVPVVRSLEGDRSIEAGANAVAAALGHARELALYNRAPAGVVFFQDPVNGEQDIAYVEQESVVDNNPEIPFQYLDLVPDEPIVTLPQGVAVQVISENTVVGNGSDSSMTKVGTNVIGYKDAFLRVGVVLFDETGQVSPSTPYCIAPGAFPGANANQPVTSVLGETLGLAASTLTTPNGYGCPPPAVDTGGVQFPQLYCASAICIYDETAFLSQKSVANGGSGLNFNDGNNNSCLYYSYFLPQIDWSNPNWLLPANGQYTYMGHQTLSAFPGQGYLVPASPPSVSTSASSGTIDQANEEQWLTTNGQIFAIKTDDGSLLRNQ